MDGDDVPLSQLGVPQSVPPHADVVPGSEFTIGLPGTVPRTTKKERTKAQMNVIATVFSRVYLARDNASPSTSVDVPVTEGVLANSLAKVLDKLLDSTALSYAIPFGFGPQLVRRLYKSLQSRLPCGTGYVGKHYVSLDGGKFAHAPCVYGGRAATTRDDFDQLIQRLANGCVQGNFLSEKYAILVKEYVDSRGRGDAAQALRQALKDDVVLERATAQVRNAFNQPACPAQPQAQRRVVERKTSDTIMNDKESAFHLDASILEQLGRLSVEDRDEYFTYRCATDDETLKVIKSRCERAAAEKNWILSQQDRDALKSGNNAQGNERTIQEDEEDEVERCDASESESESESDDPHCGSHLDERQRKRLRETDRQPLGHLNPNFL
jgi:hypothetical protein